MGEVWFAPDDPSLPMPWKGVVDGNTGCLYYWNPETNITQYEKPAYWVSSPSLSSSCSPDPFYPHYQAPTETVINGYTFPTQFPFPNHTHTPTNQPISPQSQSTDFLYHSLTHPPIAHPSYHLPPFATPAYPSEFDYGYLSSLPYPSDQPFSCDPYSTSPHNSSYSPITYPHPEPKDSIVPPYAADLIPPSALAYTAGGTSCTEKDNVPPPKMKKSLRRNLKMRSHVMMKRKPRSQFPRRRRTQNNGGSKGDLCKASSPVAVNWDSIVSSDKSVDSLSELTVLDLVVKNGSISVSSKNAPLFFPGDKKKPFLRVEAVYGQMLGPDEFCNTRAKDLLRLANFQRIKDNSGDPLVDWELKLIDVELASFYFNISLEKPIMNSAHIPAEDEQNAIVNHFCNLVVAVDHFSLVTNFLLGLNPILLSMSFVESPVILEVSIPESYEHGSKHEAGEFEKFMVCSFTVIELIKTLQVAHFTVREKNVLSSSKGDFAYDVHLENFIESSPGNSQKFFVNMHGRGIERQCPVLYHCLLSYLNWDQKSISDAFLRHEFSVSCVTMKFLLFEFCKSGSQFKTKAMVAAPLVNMDLKVVICAHWKVMDYTLHLVGAPAIQTVGHPISTIVVDNQNFCGSLIVFELSWGLLTVAVPFAAMKQLLVIGINSTSLVTASIEDFCNNKLLVCSLIITITSRNCWGQFISLDKSNSDGQLKLRAQSIFCLELQLMDRSCVELHTAHKQFHFILQLQTISGIISFTILAQLKKTYKVICFVILIEGYLMNCLLSSEDQMSEHWLNKSFKFGEYVVHELSQCMYNMMISRKLDDISWKLLVIKVIQVVLKEDANFYYYDKWDISLVILHFGCRSFFFPYERVGHFRTDAENPTTINRGVKYGNMLSCTMTTVTFGHFKLHGLLEIDDDETAPNALECLIGLLHHDIEVYFGYFLGIPEIYVAWKNTKSLPVFYINLSNRILDEDLEYIMKTLVSTNATVLRSTTWNIILIFHGSHCQAFSLSLFVMTSNPFYTATVATKVRPGEPTLLKVTPAIFSVTEIALGHHNSFLEEADSFFNFHSMVIPLRCCSATFAHNWGYWLNWELMPHATWNFILMITTYFIVLRRVIFGGIHTANSLGILQTGQEEYNVHSYMKTVNAHRLLILNPSDVVVKMGLLILSTYFKLIFALVVAKRIVDTEDMIKEVLGKVTVHDAVPFIMLSTGSCGYWNAKQAKAKGFHAIMWGAEIQSTENLINEDPSNVAAHTNAPWLHLEDIWFNFPLAQF